MFISSATTMPHLRAHLQPRMVGEPSHWVDRRLLSGELIRETNRLLAMQSPRRSWTDADRRAKLAAIGREREYDRAKTAAGISDEQLCSVAHHEAGHAMWAHTHGLRLTAVELLPDPATWGVCRYVKESLSPDLMARFALVGVKAESRLVGKTVSVTADDGLQFARATNGVQRLVRFAHEMAESFVERRWPAISGMAIELLKHRIIEGDDLRAMCDRLLA